MREKRGKRTTDSWLQKRRKWGSELSNKRAAKNCKNRAATQEKSGCKNFEERGQRRNQRRQSNNKVEGGQIQPRRKGQKINKTINQRWDQPPNKATTRSTSPETGQSSWMYARMLMGKEKQPQNYVALGIKSQAYFLRSKLTYDTQKYDERREIFRSNLRKVIGKNCFCLMDEAKKLMFLDFFERK